MDVQHELYLAPDKFNKLFPFHISLDDRGTILSVGTSLKKISAIAPGCRITDFFSVKRPTLQTQFDAALLVDQVVILEATDGSGIILRGQVETLSTTWAVFVGTPWFATVDGIVNANLSIRDFAMHDPMIDLLHVLQTQDVTMREVKDLLIQVNNQKNIVKESEERISSLIVNLQTGILLEDEAQHIVLCNKMFCDLFQIPVPPQALYGTDCSQAAERSKYLFKDPEAFTQGIQTLLRARQTVLCEQLELADGKVVERDYVPIFVSQKYRGHLWRYTDVTDRVNYQRKLRKQEEKYRSIIENMRLGMLETDLRGHVRYANSNFCEMSGYTPHELDGRNAYELLRVANAAQLNIEKQALRSRGVSDCFELVVTDKKDHQRCWFISSAPNYNDAGELMGSIDIHLDISDRKTLEEALRVALDKSEESSKAKESFLANMSHEIRTPLNAIIGMVRALSRLGLSGAGATYLQHADSASQHLLSIVNNILDISKIEAGEFHFDNRVFNLQAVLQEAEAIIGPSIRDKSLNLHILYTQEISTALVGDPSRIRQILLNILGNAVKFTEKGSITVQCTLVASHDDKQRICISIEDTGIGIEKAYLNSLFKKFTQEDLSTGRRFGGTGLGMAITYELVHLMGGEITVESEKGKGTRFEVILSLPLGEPSSRAIEKRVDAGNMVAPINVLLVEDNELNRLVATNTLTHHGMEVDEVDDGLKALSILKHRTYDVILMDLQMPGMDGLETTRMIRTLLQLTTPIIALTANAFSKEIEKCMRAGMNDYVTKPFEEKVLVEKVMRHARVGQVHRDPPRSNEPDKRLYSLDTLEHMSHGNRDFVSKMAQAFCATIETTSKTIVETALAGDYTALRAVAHKIKPTVAMFCMNAIHDEIFWLENLEANAGEAAEVNRVATHVQQVLVDVAADLMRRGYTTP